jgi:hypothetical protein
MKKVYFLALLTVAVMFASKAKAQVGFGVKGGLDVTSMSISGDVFDESNRAGWFFGPTLKITLPLVGWGVDASALYDYQSAGVTDDNDKKTTVKQQQVEIPVNLRYSVGLGSTANIFFFAGPQWAFNVGGKNFKWDETSNYSFKKTNFSVNLGLGCTLLKHLQLSANYNIACGKSANLSFMDAAGKVFNNNSHNNAWQLGVAYFF